MKAIVTVGLGFGDEGKGATVDFLTRSSGAELVVRYCGGPQAGHNVQLPDGRRHTFSQFGAGTLAGAQTWLGPRMIIAPAAMQPEADHLRTLGVTSPFSTLSAHPGCLVSTYFHVCMNRLRETARGDARHGSCGLGVGETRNYWIRYGQDAVFARDLRDRGTLVDKLSLLRDRFLLKMQELARVDDELSAQLHNFSPAREADELRRAAEELSLAERMPSSHTTVFEGAQGVLLDEWKGFHPHTTWSTVTPHHALEIIEEHGIADTTILGVTRAYSTRHGAGPFPTWSPDFTLDDPGNPKNAWQGSIRFGPLDLVLLNYAASVCDIDGIVVTCLDQLPSRPQFCTAYADTDRIAVPRTLAEQSQLTTTLESAVPRLIESTTDGILAAIENVAPVVMTADGPTHVQRKLTARSEHERTSERGSITSRAGSDIGQRPRSADAFTARAASVPRRRCTAGPSRR
jgi:adenylosuccinate synthase